MRLLDIRKVAIIFQVQAMGSNNVWIFLPTSSLTPYLTKMMLKENSMQLILNIEKISQLWDGKMNLLLL